MELSWDPSKAKSNFAKHGVSFPDAEPVLFDDPFAITVEDDRADEGRYVTVGMDALDSSSFTQWGSRSGSFRQGLRLEENRKLMKQEYDFSQGKRGAVVPQKGKTRITMYLDNEVLMAFRALSEEAGNGYQTMINQALRDYLDKVKIPVDEETLRRVLREELQGVD